MTDETPAEVRRRFDERAATYDDSDMHRGLADAVAAFADLRSVRAVLDVATGTGLVLRALRARAGSTGSPGMRMTGVDLSPGMLAVARAALPDAELIETDATSLPLPDASVDLVPCVPGLQIFPAPDTAIQEWARVLRPGGRAITATFSEVDLTQHRGAHPGRFQHDRFRTPQLMSAALAPAGLEVSRHRSWTHGADTVLIAEAVRVTKGE